MPFCRLLRANSVASGESHVVDRNMCVISFFSVKSAEASTKVGEANTCKLSAQFRQFPEFDQKGVGT